MSNFPIKKVAVLGAGVMGAQIAAHCINARVPVILFDLPGKPDQPRTAHLPAITCPVLIVQGEHDVFGTPREMEPVIAAMQAPVTLHVVPGADHSFKVRGRRSEEIYQPIVEVITRFCTAGAGAPAATSPAPAG